MAFDRNSMPLAEEQTRPYPTQYNTETTPTAIDVPNQQVPKFDRNSMPKAFNRESMPTQEEGDVGILEAIAMPGEAIRAGIISTLEGQGIEATKENIKAAWSTQDPRVKDSFMQLINEQFDKVRLAPEGTYNPVLTALAKNAEGSALVTVGLGLTADIIADPISWIGGIIGTTGKVGGAIFKNTPAGRKLRQKKASKIEKKIKDKQAELVAREGMDVKEAGILAYMQKTPYHGLLDDVLDIKTAGQVRPALNKSQLRKRYEASKPTSTLGKLTDEGFRSIGKLNEKLFRGSAGIDKAIQPILSRMDELNAKVGNGLREFEFTFSGNLHTDLQAVKTWITQFRKLPKDARLQLTKHLNNQDFTKAFTIMGRVEGMADEFSRAVSPLLKQRGLSLARTNADLTLLNKFYPRSVKDRDGLVKALGIDDSDDFHRIIYDDMLKKGRKLTPTETADAINRSIRKPSIETITKKIGAESKRKIDKLDDGLMTYYDEADTAILSYLRDVNHAVSRREFFGKFAKGVDDIDGIETSIGALIREERKAGRLANRDVKTVEEILKARFIGGEKGANALISGAKSAGYMMTLGNPFSAMTQLGDLGTSAFLHGIINTAVQSVKGLLGKRKINFEDFGLDLMAELADVSKSQKHLASIFKWSGFRAVDVFGKNVNINASLAKWSKVGKSGKDPVKWYKYDSGKLSLEKQLRNKYKNSFDEARLDTLVDDFRNYGQGTYVNGKLVKGQITEDMRYVVFSDLIDAQPVVQSAMPQAYLNNPNARIMWQLKTFALKQLDLVRQRAFKRIKQGDVLGGTAELVRYGAIVGGANTGSEALKMSVRDWINGGDKLKEMLDNDEGGYPALIVANTLKVFGMNSVLRDKVTSGYWEGAAADLAIPPVLSTGGDVFSAITGQAEIWKGVRQIPIAGKVLYYMFGEEADDTFGKL
jgi:hypothetical protein